MFRTIVVGTNWSDTADVAFAKAVELARLGGARLHVVSATGAGPAPVSVSGGGPYSERPDFQVDRALDDALARLGATGEVDVQQHVVERRPGRGDPGRGARGRRRPDRGRQQGHAPARAVEHPQLGLAQRKL